MLKIKQILDFIVEIEQLKNICRKTKPVGLERYENSAEHSWHVCLSALLLKDFANETVNIDRVIKMLLIHDLGEIEVGDTIVYASENQELKKAETNAITSLFQKLPDNMGNALLDLWYEFEAGETADAKFAKAIDRVPPLLHNIHGQGHSWQKYDISKEQVFLVNERIAKGSEVLWRIMQEKLEQAVDDSILKSGS